MRERYISRPSGRRSFMIMKDRGNPQIFQQEKDAGGFLLAAYCMAAPEGRLVGLSFTEGTEGNRKTGGEKMLKLEQELKGNAYPGRGIVIGRSADGKNAVIAYFIMGRSVNSRNRIFVTEGEGIRTQAFDPSKLSDPSLVIYAPVRVLKNDTIVTNGDQTDTVYQGLEAGQTFEQSLKTREYEPDGPNYTPRISGVVHCKENCFDYEMSILKSNDGDPSCCNRYTFSYDNPAPGQGRFIHTYMHDGDPLPSFLGEPKAVVLEGDIDAFAGMLWESLNEENKVSLFVRYIDLATGKYETRILNKNQAV